MMKRASFPLRFNVLSLLILLWATPAVAGSSDEAPAPECKAAIALFNLAFLDVEEAHENFQDATKKMGEASEVQGRVLESYQKGWNRYGKSLDSAEEFSPEGLPSKELLERAEAEWKRSWVERKSAQDRFRQVRQMFNERLDNFENRCGLKR